MCTIAVVPIFTSAGTALLPMILAAIASFAAIILKPRELVMLMRRRPVTVGVSAGATVCAVAVLMWFWVLNAPSRAAVPAVSAAAPIVDWAKVARDIIAREQSGMTPTFLLPPTGNTADKAVDMPLGLGRDGGRCFYGGGPSPLKLQRRWNFRPEDTMFISSPIVSGKRVFVGGCQSDLGGYTGLLACLDMDSGKPLWQVTEADGEPLRPFFSSPALTRDGKYLVIGQGLHEDANCSLLCFDTATGQLHWAVKTALHIESSPAIRDDAAIVGAGAIEGKDGKAIGDPGYVLAVRISDGKVLWRQAVNDPESSPVIDDDGIVYIGSGCNGNAMVALHSDSDEQLRDKKRDRQVWRTATELPVTSPVTLLGNMVIAGEGNGDFVHSNASAQGAVVAVNRNSGKIVWKSPFDDAVLGVIAGRDDMLICPSRNGTVTALSARDGHVLWRSPISGNAPVLAGCAFTGKQIYAVSSDGYLAVLDPHNGKVLSKTYLNDQAKPGSGLTMSSPTVVDGCVIVGSETGGLHCFAGSEAAP